MLGASSTDALRALLATFGRDGKEFEHLTKWFLENDPEYKAKFARVWLWDEWPDRWDRDRGIDLVAKTHEGPLVAVQAKNYAERHSITKRDVDTFLTESARAAFAERLLVGTTDRLASSGRAVMAAQEKPVATCLLSRLRCSPVQWPDSIRHLRPTVVERAQPRPHQQEALAAIERWGASDSSRAQVIMACGTGKTLVSVGAADRLGADRVLVLVPTHALLRQTAERWVVESAERRRLLRVCSDRVRVSDDPAAGDDLTSPGLTDPAEIAAVLASSDRLLVLCTYDSSPALAKAISEVPQFRFDLAIADEAHRCSGLERSAHKTILSDGAIPADRRLFFTATPTVYGTRDKGNLRRRSVPVASMDDPALFGRVIYHLHFAEAIERGLLCPYQVAVIPISDEEVHELIKRQRLVTADGDHVLEAASLATQIACGRAMRRFGCSRVVAFHPSIRESKRFAAHFPVALGLMDEDERPVGPVWSEHVDGDAMPYATRARRLERFSSPEPAEHRMLSNVRMLTEGVDVPGIDSIAFVHTHRGQAAIIQAVGRAVRPAPGKTVGTIVLPIVLRKDEPFAAAIARSEHRHIVDILGALRSHDPQIQRSLDDLRFHSTDRPTAPVNTAGFFAVDAPLEVGEDFADAVDLALTDALAVTTERRRRRRSAATPVIVGTTSEPSPDEAFLIGLNELRTLGRFFLVTRLPESSGTFPLRVWWQEAKRRWAAGELDEYDRDLIANALSWLSADLTNSPRIRREMSVLTSADVCEQIASQLLPGGSLSEDGYAELVETEREAEHFVDELRTVHRAITHAAMSPETQVRLLRLALDRMLLAVRHAEQGEEPSLWYFLSRRQTAIAGFAFALDTRRKPSEGPRFNVPANVRDAFDAGVAAAAPLLPLVARMLLFRFPHDEDEVSMRRYEEESLDPDARFDALGWDIYLLTRARGGGVPLAAAQAMDGNLRSRRRVRCDLLARATRETRQQAA